MKSTAVNTGEIIGKWVVIVCLLTLGMIIGRGYCGSTVLGLVLGAAATGAFLRKQESDNRAKQERLAREAAELSERNAQTERDQQARERASAEREARIRSAKQRAAEAAQRMSFDELGVAHARLLKQLGIMRARQAEAESVRFRDDQQQREQWNDSYHRWAAQGQMYPDRIADDEAGEFGLVMSPDSFWSRDVDSARLAGDELEVELSALEEAMAASETYECTVQIGAISSLHHALEVEVRAECSMVSAQLVARLRFDTDESRQFRPEIQNGRIIVAAEFIVGILQELDKYGQPGFGQNEDWRGETCLAWVLDGSELASTGYVPFIARALAG